MSERNMWHFRQHVEPHWWGPCHGLTAAIAAGYAVVYENASPGLAMVALLALGAPWSLLMTRTYFEWR